MRPIVRPSVHFILILLSILTACGGTSYSPEINPKLGRIYVVSATPLVPALLSAGGGTSTATITVTPGNGYSGKVTLSCAEGGGVNPAPPTCSFSPNPVAVSATYTAKSTLTVSTSPTTDGGTYTISVTGADTKGVGPINREQSLTLTNTGQIEHVVVIFQENRTPDNLFQDPVLISRGADIRSSGLDSAGQTVPLTPTDLGTIGSDPLTYDLSHTHSAFAKMYDGGKMDGADKIDCLVYTLPCPILPQFKYVKPEDIQPYFALAEQYTFGDRMFQTNEGPSFPAHQFILAGTSAPTATSKLFAAENPLNLLPDFGPSGCIAGPTNTVALIDPYGNENSNPATIPCYDHPTLTDLLDNAGFSWRYYAPSAGSIWTAPDAIEHICQEALINGMKTCTGPEWLSKVVFPETGVLTDIAAGQLAQVSWVVPDGAHSDHAYANDGSGPSWVASVVNAIGNSQYWKNTAIIITWDDWGGWYDHVPPTVINDGVSWGSGYVYGFRVPLIVVSPYAKAGYISHKQHDFGSILKYIETLFNLPSLGYADTPADNLSDCFSMTQSPLRFKTISAPLDAAYFLNNKKPPIDPDDD